MKRKPVRRSLWGIFSVALALSVLSPAAHASSALLPLKKPKPAQHKQVTPVAAAVTSTAQPANLLPVRKPGMMAAALAEGIKAKSYIGKVFNDLTTAKRLSEEDAARYQHIFAFQDTGDFAMADEEIAKLEDDRLMGHVLQQRYTSADYKTSYAELADWMKNYADHPGAQKIYDMAVKRQPSDAGAPASPESARGVFGRHDFDVGQLAQPYLVTKKLSPRERDIVKAIEGHLAERPTAALKRLESEEAKKLFTATEYDALQAQVAESYFYNGKNDKALEYAAKSFARSGKDVPKAGWIAGLAAWKNKDYAQAAKYFEKSAVSKRSSAWMSAAAAYWAARSHLRAQEPDEVAQWLAKATEHPRTFYGIIAMKALGMDQASFNWEVPSLKDKHVRELVKRPAGKRALALADVGRADLAEMELARINPGDDEDLQEAMIAIASEKGMPWMSLRMGSAFKNDEGDLFDAALYPDVPWVPEKGFEVDRALVYAFIRQESRFSAEAQNKSSGAVGLMQLMPATAKHVAKVTGMKIDVSKLKDPVVNIDLGQKYLAELLGNEHVDNNLFKLAVAYNAGPGKLARWEKAAHYAEDPLLFIESIPAAETRIFVERVLTNYWIYRIKFEQDTESLDKVAEGGWPVYVAHDIRRGSVFADAATYLSR